jgi:integrase
MSNQQNGELPKGIRIIRSAITGKVTYEATAAVVNGKKIRKEFGEERFDGHANALAAAKYWLEDMRKEVRENRSTVVEIPHRDRWIYLVNIEKITEAGITFQQCIEAGLRYHREHTVRRGITVDKAVEEFLSFKRRQGRKESYFRSLAPMLRAFAGAFKERKMHEITTQDIERFLDKREIGSVSWNNWRRDLRTLFNFGRTERNGWVKSNPAEEVMLRTIVHEEVTILSINDAKKVLAKALELYPRVVPFMVLGIFGGLRREEAQNALWEDVNWDHGTIRVRNAKARSVANRYVHMEPVFKAWLEKCRPKEGGGPMCTMQYARRNDLQELSVETSVDCTENIYRHSFGSYHYANFENKPKTMLEMGHTNPTTFDRYYRRAIPRPIARQYWELTPEAVLSA